MYSRIKSLCLYPSIILGIVLLPFLSFGSNNFTSKIPNGSVFSCDNCHGGTFMNNFGNDFQGNNNTWNQNLAVMDSDGDGYSNGEELQDNNGAWSEGQAQPGNQEKVTNPGDSSSFPQEATPTPTATTEPTPTPTPSDVQKLEINTDKSSYQKGDVVKLLLTLHVGDKSLNVDLYLVMLDPSSKPYFFPTWSLTPDFVTTSLPANFEVNNAPIMNFTIPNNLPPIKDNGRYIFYFALAESGTTNFLGGIVNTKFEIYSGCPSDMISIPEGEFMIGDSSGLGFEDEKPAHTVKLSPFCIDKFEYPNVEGEVPEYGITYYQMGAHCTDAGKRLCTESEWERACTGPDNFIYPYGNEYNQEKCHVDYLAGNPVASGSSNCASGFGVYDMAGNVWEWTADWYDTYYYELRVYDNPKGPDEGEYKVLKGGAWYSGKYGSRCSVRYVGFPDAAKNGSGGRCCK
jgi:hypothetical protein